MHSATIRKSSGNDHNDHVIRARQTYNLFSAQYYTQCAAASANQNRREPFQGIGQQNQVSSKFDKVRAQQASSLRDEHIDRMFSSAIARGGDLPEMIQQQQYLGRPYELEIKRRQQMAQSPQI